MALGILCLSPALANAASAQQEYGLPPSTHLTWRSSPPDGTSIDVTYFVTPVLSPFPPFVSPLPAPMAAAIASAASAWNGAGALVQLVPVGSLGAAGIDIIANTVGFLPALGTPPFLAHSPPPAAAPPTYPDGDPWRQLTASLFFFDTTPALPWYFGPGPAPPGMLDFYAYMLRQFGFALGLGAATTDTASVMRPFGPGTVNRTLSPGDIAALQHIYGSPEPATWVLFGLGLAALGAARRKMLKRAGPGA